MDVSTLIDSAVSHAMTLGLFDTVNQYEPKAAPGNGLTCAIWSDSIDPIPAASGLNATTARVALSVRIYTSMLSQPYDAIDVHVMEAVDALMGLYSNDFTFDGLVRNVDLLGAHGEPLRARAGYIEQDKKLYRVMTITLPVVINDVWTQVP